MSAEASLETAYIKLGDIFHGHYDHENTKIPKRSGVQKKVWNLDFLSSVCANLQSYDNQLVLSLHNKVKERSILG